jgi:hypothetical protein
MRVLSSCWACRLADIAAFEDEKLVLALLVQPWLGSVEDEAVLECVLSTKRPVALVESACRNVLGLPATAAIPLQLPHGKLCSHNVSASDTNASTETMKESAARFAAVPAQLRWTYDAAMACAARHAASKCHTSSPDKAGRGMVAGVRGHVARGVAAGVSKVLQVVQADPGMRSRFSWWPAAAAALWEDVLRVYPRSDNRAVGQSCQKGIPGHENAVDGVGDMGVGDAGRAAVPEGVTLNKHDVALLLQRTVMVAMVCCCSHASCHVAGTFELAWKATQQFSLCAE